MKKYSVCILAIAAIVVIGNISASGQSAYVRPDAEKRFKRYASDTVGPFAWVGIAATSGVSTAANEPEEWGKSAKGFGKRVASNFGRNVIKNTVTYGLDEGLKLDSHFYLTKNKAAGAKIGNAVLSTFTARKKDGKRTIGVPRIVGTYTANVIAREAWFPPRYTWKDGMRSGSISLGTNVLFNLFREFVIRK